MSDIVPCPNVTQTGLKRVRLVSESYSNAVQVSLNVFHINHNVVFVVHSCLQHHRAADMTSAYPN